MTFLHNDITEQVLFKLTDYNKAIATTPSERQNKSGWTKVFQNQSLTCQNSSPSLLLIGDSIIAGLDRYNKVKKKFCESYSTINCGIGGDRTQHVLWRCEKMVLPTSLKHAVVNCGTNNLKQDSPLDIASGIILVGLALKKKCPHINVIITGIIPRGLKWSRIRSKINKTNLILKKLSKINELFYKDNNFG